MSSKSESPFEAFESAACCQPEPKLKARLNYDTGSTVQNFDLNIWSDLPIALETSSENPSSNSERLFKLLPQPINERTPEAQAPEVVIFFMPGNPGMVQWYQPFLAMLFSDLKSNSISSLIVSESHLSHCIRANNSLSQRIDNVVQSLKEFAKNLSQSWLLKPFDWSHKSNHESLTLEEQVDYHNKVFENVYFSFEDEKSSRKTRFIVIGHSVGAYIATKVLERNEHRIDHMIGLFPTISEIGKTKNAEKLKVLFSPMSWPIINFLQLLVGFTIPKRLLVLMMQRSTGYFIVGGKEAKLISEEQEIFNSSIVVNLLVDPRLTTGTLKMARSEMKTINALNEKFLHKFKSRLSFYYAGPDEDDWVKEEEVSKVFEILGGKNSLFDSDRDAVATSLGKVNETFDSSLINRKKHDASENSGSSTDSKRFGSNLIRGTEKVPHAFCLEYSDIMVPHCSNWIQNTLRNLK